MKEGKVGQIGISNCYDATYLQKLLDAGNEIKTVQNRWYEGNGWDWDGESAGPASAGPWPYLFQRPQLASIFRCFIHLAGPDLQVFLHRSSKGEPTGEPIAVAQRRPANTQSSTSAKATG